ncbi:unnamed protein product, partial [Staurois parvus]
GTLPPCAGGQQNFAPLCWWSGELCPLCWWSGELCPLVLVDSRTLLPCAGGQQNFAPLCWWSVEAPLLCVSFMTKDGNVWVVFSKVKPQFSGLLAVLAL